MKSRMSLLTKENLPKWKHDFAEEAQILIPNQQSGNYCLASFMGQGWLVLSTALFPCFLA